MVEFEPHHTAIPASPDAEVQPAPVVEYVAQTPDVTYAAPAPVAEYDAQAPTMTYRVHAAPASVVAPAPTVAYWVPENTMTLPATVDTQPVTMVPIASATVLPTTYGVLESAAPAPAVYATHADVTESTAPAPAVHAAPAYVMESTASTTAVCAAQVPTLTKGAYDPVAHQARHVTGQLFPVHGSVCVASQQQRHYSSHHADTFG